MNAGGLAQMASFNNFTSGSEFGVPTSGFTSRRGSTIKSLSFDQSKISGLPENSVPTPRTSRSHLLAGLRTAPKSSRSPGPLTAPPYLLQHNPSNALRYTTESMNHCDPMASYNHMDQQNICNGQLYTMPEDILAPPEIHIDESGCEQMDVNYYAQLVATNRYLAEQQQRLQQQLLNVQAAAQQFQGMNLGIQQCSTPPITPQSLYQQQLKYNLQTASSPSGNMLPMYPFYNTLTGKPTYIQLNQQTGHFENLQNGQSFANYTSPQRTTLPTRTTTSTLSPESTSLSRSASPPEKPRSPAYDHTPLPPPSAGAFRRGHRKVPSSLAVYSEQSPYLDVTKLSVTPKTLSANSMASSGFGPGQARIGEHPIRQPRGPPSIDILLAKPTSKYEGAKNFATRTRRSAVDNLVRAGIERRRAPGSAGSGSISPASDAGEFTFSVTDNDSDSGRSGGGSLSSRPTLGSPRTSIHGAIGSNRPSVNWKIPHAPTTELHRPHSQWPLLSGAKDSFDFIMLRFKIKAQGEVRARVTTELICLNMVEAIPDEKKLRLSPWFRQCNNYKWKELHSYMQKSFCDKKNDLAAGQTLARMRQGKHQFFRDFMKDFEHQLALAGGENWPSDSKLSHLSTAIKKSLEDDLVFVDLPLQYEEWVVKVVRTASKPDNLGIYRPVNSKFTETWFSNDSIMAVPYITQNVTTHAHRIDKDSDIIMEDNTLAVMSAELQKISSRLESLEYKGKQPQQHFQKPRAPSRQKSEFYRLIENGLCTRCAKAGHQSRQCPNFKGPIKKGIRS